MDWIYARNFGVLPSGQAEQVEALVAIAEQLERIANALEEANGHSEFAQNVALYSKKDKS